MIKKTIEIDVNTSTAVKDVDKLTDSVKDLEKETEKVSENGLQGVGDGAKKAGKGVKGLSANFKALGGAIKATGIGLLVAALAALVEGLQQNERASKFFKVAVEAVSIVTQDFINFVIDNSGKVIDFFKAIFENPLKSIKDLGQALQDNLLERFNSFLDLLGFVGDAFKKFTEGDFSGALDSIKDAGKELIDVGTGVNNTFDKVVDGVNGAVESITEYGSEISKTSKKNIDLAKSAEIAAAKQGLLVEQYDRQAEKLRQTRDNDLLSIDERIKANDDLAEVLNKQEEALLREADAILASAQAQFKKNNNTENSVALLDAQANRAGVVAQIEGLRSEQLSNETALIKEKNDLVQAGIEADEQRAIRQKEFDVSRIEDETERLNKEKELLEEERVLEEERLQLKIDSFTAGTQARLDAENELKDRLQEIDQQITINEDEQNKQRVENDKAAAASKAQIQNAVLDVAQQGINVLKQVFEKNKEIQAGLVLAENAAGIAKILTNTAVANAAAIAALPLTGGQPFVSLNTISAGLGIASSVAATAKALGQLGKSGGASGASIPSGEGGGSTPPAFNLVGGSNVNEIGDTLNQEQQPVQAFVVGSEVTNQQELDNAQASSASLS